MKTLLISFSLALITSFFGQLYAQQQTQRTIEREHQFVEGSNTISFPNVGTVRFTLRAGNIQNATIQDTAGKITNLGIGGPSGDPNAQVKGCDSNCANCKNGGCSKVCIDYYCCYFCAGNTLTSSNKGSTEKPASYNLKIQRK